MSTDTSKQQELASLKTGDVRVYMPPAWLTRRFVVFSLIGMLTVGPLPFVLLITAADQFIRNKIDDWMSDPDLYKSVILRPEEYQRLPVHWRQALAEIAVRSEPDAAGVQELIKTLTSEHITLVDLVAPYAIRDFIVRDTKRPSQHPIPALSVVDFATLQDLGILQAVQRGHEITLDLSSSPNHQANWLGTTVALVMKGTQTENKVKLPITRFTEAGISLVRLLRIPSDIRYFEWLAKKMEQSNLNVELWTIRTDQENANAGIVGTGRIQRDTVPTWPGKINS